MQEGTCVVRLGGDMLNTVKKDKVTPSEVLVLKRLHGEDAVIEVVLTSDKALNASGSSRSDKAEMDRLKEVYVDRFGGSNPDRPNVLKELFPGAAPQLPQEFSDIFDPGSFADARKDKKQEAKSQHQAGNKLTLNQGNQSEQGSAA